VAPRKRAPIIVAVDRRAEARRHAAGEPANDVERSIVANLRDEALGDDGVLGVGALVVERVDRLAALREARRAVEHPAREHRRRLAERRIVAQTLEAFFAGADDRADDPIADPEPADLRPDLDDDARPFVAEHDRERNRDIAGAEVEIRMADADGGDLELDLAGAGPGLVDLLDRDPTRSTTDDGLHDAPARRIRPGLAASDPTSERPCSVIATPLTQTNSIPFG
jgi:hypothetical protein